MAYCVNCGIELSRYNKQCPLCDTETVHAVSEKDALNTDYPDYRKESESEAKRVNRIFVGRLLSMIFFNYAVILLIINFSVNKAVTWSVIPNLSLVLVWFCVAYPFFRKHNTFFRLYTYDSVAVIIYLICLNLVISGNTAWAKYAGLSVALVWAVLAGFFSTGKIRKVLPVTVYYIISAVVFFVAFAFAIDNRLSAFTLVLPVTGLVFVMALISYFIIMAKGNDFLGVFSVAMMSLTIVCLGIDMIISNYFHGKIMLTWSLITSAVTLPLFAVMFTVKKSRELKSIISKKLHR